MENLATRVSASIGLHRPWAPARRWVNLHQWEPRSDKGGVRAAAEFARTKSDCAALLLLRDCDDDCPKELGPAAARRLAELNLPFPTAYVLLKPEYEVLFLPCIGRMRMIEGRPGFPSDLRWDRSTWEAKRDVKGWLSAKLPAGVKYKPTTDQLAMTRMIDLDLLREAKVPCFGTLERALAFLGVAGPGGVYPAPE